MDANGFSKLELKLVVNLQFGKSDRKFYKRDRRNNSTLTEGKNNSQKKSIGLNTKESFLPFTDCLGSVHKLTKQKIRISLHIPTDILRSENYR